VITSKIKHAIKLATKYCNIAATTSCNRKCKPCTTVVQILQDLFYVLSQLLVVAAIILIFIASFIACFILLVIAPLL